MKHDVYVEHFERAVDADLDYLEMPMFSRTVCESATLDIGLAPSGLMRQEIYGLKQIGEDRPVELQSEYIEPATPDVLAKLHKSPSRSSAEYFIRQDLVKLFPDNKVRHGHRPIRNANSSFLELDLQITDLQFAIEVQGPTHYQDLYGNYEDMKQRDAYKRQWCLDHQIKLMHVEWERYTKTLYRLPDAQRRETFGYLVRYFLASDELFCEVREDRFRELAGLEI